MDVARVYEAAFAAGLDYGSSFRGMASLRCGDGEAVSEVALPSEIEGAELYGIQATSYR